MEEMSLRDLESKVVEMFDPIDQVNASILAEYEYTPMHEPEIRQEKGVIAASDQYIAVIEATDDHAEPLIPYRSLGEFRSAGDTPLLIQHSASKSIRVEEVIEGNVDSLIECVQSNQDFRSHSETMESGKRRRARYIRDEIGFQSLFDHLELLRESLAITQEEYEKRLERIREFQNVLPD